MMDLDIVEELSNLTYRVEDLEILAFQDSGICRR